VTDKRSIQFREIHSDQIFAGIQWFLLQNQENGHYNKEKFWRIYRRLMVPLPALRWSLMYTLLKFKGDPAHESVWPKQWLLEAIFWLICCSCDTIKNDPRVHSLKIPRRPSTWICVTKTVAIWSNILTNAAHDTIQERHFRYSEEFTGGLSIASCWQATWYNTGFVKQSQKR